MSNNHIVQLRRGWKDDATGRDDWAEYEAQPTHIKPLRGELAIEYDNGIPRLKIGDGTSEFSELPYMSVDSFILPKPISITLFVDKWIQVVDEAGENVVDTYSQIVTVENATITPNSKVDLQPDTHQLCKLYDWGVALTTKNDNGVVTVYAVGDRPSESLSIQATVTEILLDSEVDQDE